MKRKKRKRKKEKKKKEKRLSHVPNQIRLTSHFRLISDMDGLLLLSSGVDRLASDPEWLQWTGEAGQRRREQVMGARHVLLKQQGRPQA